LEAFGSLMVTTNDQVDAAIARAQRFEADDPRVIYAEYQAMEDSLELHFADGVRVSIPRKHLQGLGKASPSQLMRIELVGNGTGLHWPLLDVDHYVLGLLGHVFGTQRWMEKIGRLGGSVKSTAKAEASRKNGLKGGRPRVRAAGVAVG
jgi:uncharacterized protein DUF2442